MEVDYLDTKESKRMRITTRCVVMAVETEGGWGERKMEFTV